MRLGIFETYFHLGIIEQDEVAPVTVMEFQYRINKEKYKAHSWSAHVSYALMYDRRVIGIQERTTESG